MDRELVTRRTAANRRLAADWFDGLDDAQLATRSLCAEWTVKEVLAHLAMPLLLGIRPLLWETVKQRGSLDRASVRIARRLAERPVAELTGVLRDRAGTAVTAPGVGPMGQMADGCLHLRDCARPVGSGTDVEPQDWRLVLDWLPTRQAALGVVPKGRLDGLRLEATDLGWSWGSGATLSGPGEAVAMAVAGRPAALDDLSGPGVAVLRARL